MATLVSSSRAEAVGRAEANAPFLRSSIAAFPAIAASFVEEGSDAAVGKALSITGESVAEQLRRQRHALALAVALADISNEKPLEWVTATLSDFADKAMDEALRAAMLERVPDEEPRGLAVLALGKLGSGELNYSSDVDLVLLFDPATLPRRPRDEPGEAAVRYGRRFIELMQQRTPDGYVARVDLRLRPSPEVTPIVLPAGAAISYYESSALPWERAAFIRARAAAGDLDLGGSFLQEIRPFIWRRALDFGAIQEIRDISLRIRDHYAQGQQFGPGYDLKRGRGGIREAEFFTQVQQLVHGGREPELRAPATLDALAALARTGRLEAEVAQAIGDAYRMLRTAEHRIQMIDDRQEHRLPADSEALEAVARLHGSESAAAFLEILAPQVEAVGVQFDALVSDRDERLSNDPDILRSELTSMGFEEVEEAFRRVADWRSGRARSLRSPPAREAFEAMLPTLMRSVAAGPDPIRSLNRFGDIVDKLSSGVNLYRLLSARPKLADLLSLILAHAPPLAEQLGRRPTLLDGLIDESSFAPPPDAAELADLFLVATRGEPFDIALDRLRRMVGERRFALGVQLLAAHRDPIVIAEGYSDLAEAAVVALTELVSQEFRRSHGDVPGGELVVLGLGRLGGRALTHASDLDLIYLFDAPPGTQSNGAKPLPATDYYNRLASRIGAALGTPTATGPLYDVDTRLRPQGAQGMLAVSLAAFEEYQRNEAWTWEHMALCRARPLTGSDAARSKVRRLICSILERPSDPARIRADAAAMREEMARHKPPAGPLDIKLGPGGLVDFEFTVHTLQLTSRIGLDPRLEVALEALVSDGLIDDGADPDLRLLSRMLVVLRLVGSKAMEPAEQSRRLVATLCGYEDWPSLLAATDVARQRIAARWARVKGDE
ncbi:bifunctional [glutamine synthetase] adenylyltransferase/[glutamine synthetase]-adenylyl-L-tyrosine phosphorylase [Sphingomonas sp. NSE70-1]|uniref:Bifunctional [glutamine synthetase] adenylyltransferase/[glutamine synthetase]-adenylyl-L-tyrosine phosphorylase n=1 Tax=Sphingomonas caseinilyticus TaxID=2908205 RepID=A0ABT0RWI7_9SPHN|nr:bifunctional [glutamine synthetase] adenylyltransferase/[glutamine synthetase]-adenylyl-L-tyrosine phosphorylase [Sphingomonas caseinilyticus]MCL6699393.1 bifunctional [glutamine synthetase] adenylyltransferase/[glutamine synthetase]-adenylyl-L-tyrosine phosphorylase [Sphingomonas caseinilyticus]